MLIVHSYNCKFFKEIFLIKNKKLFPLILLSKWRWIFLLVHQFRNGWTKMMLSGIGNFNLIKMKKIQISTSQREELCWKLTNCPNLRAGLPTVGNSAMPCSFGVSPGKSWQCRASWSVEPEAEDPRLKTHEGTLDISYSVMWTMKAN